MAGTSEEDLIDIVEETKATLKQDPQNVAAYFKQGTAYFKLEEYETSAQVLSQGLSVAQSSAKEEDQSYVSKFQQWIRKCNTNLTPDKQCTVVEEVKAPSPAQTSTPAPAPAAAPSSKPPPPAPASSSIRHEWYQTVNSVLISFFIKDRTEKDVEVSITQSSLEICIRLGGGKEYQHRFSPLYGAVEPSASSHTITKNKIEVKLQKTQEIQWRSLEGCESAPSQPPVMMNPAVTVPSAAAAVPTTATAAPPVPTPVVAYPSSSTKKINWDKLEKDVEKDEENEKEEGDAALNKLFKQIYSRSDEDTRRAMMKSFSESGGTVLSTNWSEVGAKKVEGQPPKGMEFFKPG